MNKKFSTLVAALLVSGVSGWAQTYVDGGSVSGSYTLKPAVGASFDRFIVDQASWDATFPKVSPYALSVANGARPIQSLQKVDGTKDSRYFQIAVGDAAGGKELLTMVWVAPTSSVSGHYELQIENVDNANATNIYLDRTLWEVRVVKDPVSTVLYYTLINKATQMTLQIPTSGTGVSTEFVVGGKTYQEAPVTIVAGQTNWRWADGQVASEASTIEAAYPVLKNRIRAQFSADKSIYLVKKAVTGGKITLGALIANSNDPITAAVTNSTTNIAYTPITFEAWEANPIILTADQINAELGNDKILTADQKTPGYFNFFFNPDVIGDVNTMTGSNFVAEAPKAGASRLPGDAPDGFVRFKLKDTNKYLRVDTNYYDPSSNGRYDLKMTVDAINYPRQAVLADGLFVNSGGGLALAQEGTTIADATLYTSIYSSVKVVTQLKRQSNFRPIFYPSTQSLRLQAEMIYKAAKATTAPAAPWWKQIADDAIAGTASSMAIATCATTPGTDPIYTPAAAKGYYPSFTQGLTTANPSVITQEGRVIQYKTAWASGANGYSAIGDKETNPIWNAVGNLFVEDNTAVFAAGDMLAFDPAATTAATPGTDPTIFSKEFALAHSNLVRLVTLTPGHMVLTTAVHDMTDLTYNGLLTYITLTKLKTYDDVANITPGFYYISNANKINTTLLKSGEYRYEDLAATNASFTYWNGVVAQWAVGFDNRTAQGINIPMHVNDQSDKGNIVYSSDKKEIPSAQWYISGNGGYYTMVNRESGRQWQTSYWWQTNEPNVFVNMATYTDGAGLQQTYRDTIRLEAIPQAILENTVAGYLNMSQAVAKADTSVYNFKFNSLGDVELFLGQASGTDSILKVMKEVPGAFKLERVRLNDKDIVSQETKQTDELIYGFNTTNPATQLVRAKYYIYKDEVSGNSGIEGTGIRTREYITLESGKYRLAKVKVNVGADGYTTSTNADVIAGSQADVRRAFYVKQISTIDPDQYVLVDPMVVKHDINNTGTDAHGARAFANQLTAEVQPAGLVSTASANAFDNSVFTIQKVQAYNYRDIRSAEANRDSVEFYKASAEDYLLSENSEVNGANTGLLELLSDRYERNTAFFLDTANVNDPEFPRFLLGLRSVDSVEVSSIPGHNRHIQTTADYLVNLVDSADVNPVYKYRNIDKNSETTYYRLGFLRGIHKGTNLTMNKDGKVFDLSKKGNAGMNYATFAFRYADVDRDDFFIETVYKGTQKGWLKTINNVLVVTPYIQEAEVFQVKKTASAPVANEGINASEVSVIAGKGIVTIKGAEGKTVVITNVLGQTIANTVISSDKVEISTPAGVVVVAVEGEAAVKAIVK